MKKKQAESGLEVAGSFSSNLSDFALFLSVMKHREAYECLLGMILGEQDLELEEVQVEQVVLNHPEKRAIRLDAWARDRKHRQFDTEMQNDTAQDDVRKRSRYYQGLLDTPFLKAGKETRYRYLPDTVIIFITQKDIFGMDQALYTFTEQCEEISGYALGDGTTKLFLNMESKNGTPELVSLLQYIRHTDLENPEIVVRDPRLIRLDRIVQEVRRSEEWEDIKMNLIEYGVEKGIQQGMQQGESKKLIQMVCRKLQKRKDPKKIAEELEEDENVIERICRAVKSCGTYEDWEQIYRIWKQ